MSPFFREPVEVKEPVALPAHPLGTPDELMNSYTFHKEYVRRRQLQVLHARRRILSAVLRYKTAVLQELHETKRLAAGSPESVFIDEIRMTLQDKTPKMLQLGRQKARKLLKQNFKGLREQDVDKLLNLMLENEIKNVTEQYVKPVQAFSKEYLDANTNSQRKSILGSLGDFFGNAILIAPLVANWLGAVAEIPTTAAIDFYNKTRGKDASKMLVHWIGTLDDATCTHCARYIDNYFEPALFVTGKMPEPKEYINDQIGLRCRGNCRCTTADVLESEVEHIAGKKTVPISPAYWAEQAEKIIPQIQKTPHVTKLLKSLPSGLKLPHLWEGVDSIKFGKALHGVKGLKATKFPGLYLTPKKTYQIVIPQQYRQLRYWDRARKYITNKLGQKLLDDSMSGAKLFVENTAAILSTQRRKLLDRIQYSQKLSGKMLGFSPTIMNDIRRGKFTKRVANAFSRQKKLLREGLLGDFPPSAYFSVDDRFLQMFNAYALNKSYFKTLPQSKEFYESLTGTFFGPNPSHVINRRLSAYSIAEVLPQDMNAKDFLTLAKTWGKKVAGSPQEIRAMQKRIDEFAMYLYKFPQFRNSRLWVRGFKPGTFEQILYLEGMTPLARKDALKTIKGAGITAWRGDLTKSQWSSLVKKAGLENIRTEDIKTAAGMIFSPEVAAHELMHGHYYFLPRTARDELFQLWKGQLLTYKADLDQFQKFYPNAFAKAITNRPAVFGKIERGFSQIVATKDVTDYARITQKYDATVSKLLSDLRSFYTGSGVNDSMRLSAGFRAKNIREYLAISGSRMLNSPVQFFNREGALGEGFHNWFRQNVLKEPTKFLGKYKMTYPQLIRKLKTMSKQDAANFFREQLKDRGEGGRIFYGATRHDN